MIKRLQLSSCMVQVLVDDEHRVWHLALGEYVLEG